MHEDELDPRLEFNNSGAVEIGVSKWNLPSGYITGMCVAVIVATEAERSWLGLKTWLSTPLSETVSVFFGF